MLKTKYILLAVGGKPVKAPIPGAVSTHASKAVAWLLFFHMMFFCHLLTGWPTLPQLTWWMLRLELLCRSMPSHPMMPWCWMRFLALQ